MYWIGMISGTSADGIDTALIKIENDHIELIDSLCYEWPSEIRATLVDLGQGGALNSIEALGTLDIQVAEIFSQAALALLKQSQISADQIIAIGSHGQTIRHRPHGANHDGKFPFTMQIGDPNVIAERTGISTVADFRRRDMAAGGQAAPLVPALHAALLHDDQEDRAVLNLGGIANLTLLPKSGSVKGFDTGPANALMDAWCLKHTGKNFDDGGELAGEGKVDTALLSRLLADVWFQLPAPKSTGREQFHLRWVASHLQGHEHVADVQATLLELTARTIVDALLSNQATTKRIITCGGGVHNAHLLQAIQAHVPNMIVESSANYGIDPDNMEAIAFAWLAKRTMENLPGNLPSVTGAKGPRVLGAIFPKST